MSSISMDSASTDGTSTDGTSTDSAARRVPRFTNSLQFRRNVRSLKDRGLSRVRLRRPHGVCRERHLILRLGHWVRGKRLLGRMAMSLPQHDGDDGSARDDHQDLCRDHGQPAALTESFPASLIAPCLEHGAPSDDLIRHCQVTVASARLARAGAAILLPVKTAALARWVFRGAGRSGEVRVRGWRW